jgi:hypothetical protein
VNCFLPDPKPAQIDMGMTDEISCVITWILQSGRSFNRLLILAGGNLIKAKNDKEERYESQGLDNSFHVNSSPTKNSEYISRKHNLIPP